MQLVGQYHLPKMDIPVVTYNHLAIIDWMHLTSQPSFDITLNFHLLNIQLSLTHE